MRFKLSLVFAVLCVMLVTLPAVANAQYAIDNGSYGYVPLSQGADEWPNSFEVEYTRHLGNGKYAYGKCALYKYSTIRYIYNWSMHANYGDTVVQCYPPRTADGDTWVQGVQTYCMEVINWYGSNNLGFFNSGTDQRGAPDCKMFKISRTQPCDGHCEPHSGMYQSRGEVRLWAEKDVEFGRRSVNGMSGPLRSSDWQSVYTQYETRGDGPGGWPSHGGYNYARIHIADMVGFWSQVPAKWCQDGVCPSSPPPPPPPATQLPEVLTALKDDPNTDATAAATQMEIARRRAEAYWRGRGQLSSCMDNQITIKRVSNDTPMNQPSDNGYQHTMSLGDYATSAGPAYAAVFGCNTRYYHSQGQPGQGGPGRVTNPTIYINNHYHWTTKRLCVVIAHEFGHADRQGTHPHGYNHSDGGIMFSDALQGVDPRTWPPCQSG